MIRARLAGPLPRKGEAVSKSETVIKHTHANPIPFVAAGTGRQLLSPIAATTGYYTKGAGAVKGLVTGNVISSFYAQDKNYKFDLSRAQSSTVITAHHFRLFEVRL